MDFGVTGATAVRQALAYVVPQLNNNPGTSGFSPAQWALGQSPSFPGDLLGNNLNPVHLGASFEDELSRRAVAKMAIVQAETDQKLRRALLRRYAGTNVLLSPGQTCFYWRGARSTDLEKIRCTGPATVLMREDDPDSGKPPHLLDWRMTMMPMMDSLLANDGVLLIQHFKDHQLPRCPMNLPFSTRQSPTPRLSILLLACLDLQATHLDF